MSSELDFEGANRWRRRPFVAWTVRAAVFVVPMIAGVAVAAVASLALPAAATTGQAAVRWVLLISLSLAIVLLVDQFSRRLLPLSTLLRLSLLFPGRAPSRFKVALRAGSTRRLEELADAHRNGYDGDLAHYAGLVLSLATSISSHDRKTRGHSERVRAYAELIAESVGVDLEQREKLRWAALLHDVGKLDVSAEILNKDDRLDDEEWEVIRSHPRVGAELAEPLRPWLGHWVDAVAEHHERVDGEGYPRGLSDGEICLGARIVTVADAYETMTSARSYKDPVSPAAARRELAACAGTQFDTGVVRGFMNVSVGDLKQVMAPATALLDVPVVRALSGISEPVGSGATTAAAVTVLAVGGTTVPGDGPIDADVPDQGQGAGTAASEATDRPSQASPTVIETPSPTAGVDGSETSQQVARPSPPGAETARGGRGQPDTDPGAGEVAVDQADQGHSGGQTEAENDGSDASSTSQTALRDGGRGPQVAANHDSGEDDDGDGDGPLPTSLPSDSPISETPSVPVPKVTTPADPTSSPTESLTPSLSPSVDANVQTPTLEDTPTVDETSPVRGVPSPPPVPDPPPATPVDVPAPSPVPPAVNAEGEGPTGLTD